MPPPEPAAVDVRPVAPRDRLPLLLDVWDRLETDDTVEITYDHEPRCMYHMLAGVHGREAFTFEYVEGGPEVWRIRLGRTAAPGAE